MKRLLLAALIAFGLCGKASAFRDSNGAGLFGGSTGYLPYWVSGVQFGNSGIFWDAINGSLGIGTATPSQQIEVAGNIAVGNEGFANIWRAEQYFLSPTTGHTFFLMNGAGAYLGTLQNDAADVWCAGHSLAFSTALGTPVLCWTATDRVGIGTKNPQSALDVAGALSFNGVVAQSSATIHFIDAPMIASLASGSTFYTTPPLQSAITLVGIAYDPQVVSVGGTGDQIRCNDASNNGLTVTSANGTTSPTTAMGRANIAQGAVISCHIDSGAATKPIGVLALQYIMQ